MVDVFEQVEDELRSERYKRLARRWGPILAGVLVLALIAALGWWGYDSWKTSQADKASVQYAAGLEALQAGDAEKAGASFAAAEKFGGAYEALSLQQRAGIALAQNKPAEAVALFDQAADAAGDPLLHDIAVLKAAYLRMDADAPLAELEERLSPIAEEGRPYRPFAQEALGVARLRAGQVQPAREAFTLLTLGQNVPDTLRQRAQAAIETIDAGLAPALAATLAAVPAEQPRPAPNVTVRPTPAPAAAQ